MGDKESCGNCYFWRRSNPEDEGECRRRAPSPHGSYAGFNANLMGHMAWALYMTAETDPRTVEDFDTHPRQSDTDAYWPRTRVHEWCGEWRQAD